MLLPGPLIPEAAMYKLAERPGDSAGVYCGAGGLFLGRSPLIARIGATYRIRVDDEIAGLLAAAYGSIEEAERLRPRLRLIRSALQDGDHCRAMILAVQARLGPVAAEGIARLAQTESLCKYNFNPDEPARPARPLDIDRGRGLAGRDQRRCSSRTAVVRTSDLLG